MIATNLYRSLSMSQMVLSKDDREANFWDSEGLVIWCSICEEGCWGEVDWFWWKDYGKINDWVDGERILVGDEGCWIFFVDLSVGNLLGMKKGEVVFIIRFVKDIWCCRKN